jgi:hypothetical protein
MKRRYSPVKKVSCFQIKSLYSENELRYFNKTLVTLINNKNKPYYLINYQLSIN